MHPGNVNTIPDHSDLITQWSLNIQTAGEIIEQSETMLTLLERMFSLVHSSFNEIVLQYFSLEESELERIRAGFHEAEILVTKVKILLESMKEIQSEARDKVEFITLHVSEHDCQNEVIEIKNLIDLFQRMTFLILENINQFQSAVAGIKERILTLAETYSSTDSDE
ncbi:hypothetical protein TNCV_2240201 [Trichonephila clavipes]|nr:hypothetical protein TNCV_2240201 [Trichonephila clavipes]